MARFVLGTDYANISAFQPRRSDVRVAPVVMVLETTDGQKQGSFKIREGSNPRSMDVTTTEGAEVPAIYEVSGDTLKVCHAVNGASRPTEFKSGEGSDHVLAIYKRKSL